MGLPPSETSDDLAAWRPSAVPCVWGACPCWCWGLLVTAVELGGDTGADPACGVPPCPPPCPIVIDRALTSRDPQVRSSDSGDTCDSQEAWEVTSQELGEAERGMLALLEGSQRAGSEWRRGLCVCVCVCVSFSLSFKTFEDKCFIRCLKGS